VVIVTVVAVVVKVRDNTSISAKQIQGIYIIACCLKDNKNFWQLKVRNLEQKGEKKEKWGQKTAFFPQFENH